MAVEVELQWSELPALIVDRNLRVRIARGATLCGDVLAVREDSLLLQVRNTPVAVPRREVSVMEVRKLRDAGGRPVGVIAGVLCGLTIAALVVGHWRFPETGAVAAFLATAIVCSVSGYWVGRWIDRRRTVIRIVPTRPAT